MNKIICHNCLQQIKKDEHRRRIRVDAGRAGSKIIYIHWPRCPEGADPDAHYEQNVLEGATVYNLIPEAKYIKEDV